MVLSWEHLLGVKPVQVVQIVSFVIQMTNYRYEKG
jgi:hypothetical protein